jgi:hypothetical protein
MSKSAKGIDVLRNFEEFGRRIAEPPMPTLKFRNGGFFVNNGAVDVFVDNVKLVSQMPTLRVGWVRYDCSFPVKSIMGKVSENFQPPAREDLGDDDKSLWPEVNGQPSDPWHATEDIVLYDPDRGNNILLVIDNDAHNHVDFGEEGYLCETESLGILCQIYAAHARRVPDELPLIELTSRLAFTHPISGDIFIPQIDVVDWWSEERSTAAARAKWVEEKLAEEAKKAVADGRSAKLPRKSRAQRLPRPTQRRLRNMTDERLSQEWERAKKALAFESGPHGKHKYEMAAAYELEQIECERDRRANELKDDTAN